MYTQLQAGTPLQADVAIIGAGVSGASVARTLSRYSLDVILLEKTADVCFGTSKANSGIVHGGFHHHKKYLKTKLEIQGNLMFDQLHRELDFPFERCGILVAAMNEEELKHTQYLYQQGIDNGAIGIEMCSRDRIRELEPKLHTDVIGGVYAPSGGIVEPYRFGFAMVESAHKNGVTVVNNFPVSAVSTTSGDNNSSKRKFTLHTEDGRSVSADFVVNAAGLFADDISRLFGAEDFQIRPRKGQYYLLDRWSQAAPKHVVFPVPSSISKGVLVIRTVEGTVLIGPTADDVEDKHDTTTTNEKLDQLVDGARKLVPGISTADIITSFAGLRPALADGDFYIDESKKVPGLIQTAGIQSPGLTAAPAIGEYVKDLLKKAGCTLTEKPDFDPFLARTPRLRDADTYEAEDLIKQNPSYCRVVCRCENVSEAEIIAAIKAGHTTLDGIKFYSRAGMGRCQGGFCTHHTIQLIEEHSGIPYTNVSKHGPGSEVFISKLGDYPADPQGGQKDA